MKLLYIDLFCGAGGTSTGVENARHDGRQCAKVIGCVNHDANAIASHAANHPDALHFTEDIRTLELSPLTAHIAEMRRQYPDAFVVLWASLECTNFSKAKGGQPRDADSRTLAEHLFRYIEAINPDYIQIENVEEFMSWGDLDENGKPISKDAGRLYQQWVSNVCGYGYRFAHRILNSADYGAYTTRRRFFGIFAKESLPIVFPEPTHSKDGATGLFGRTQRWKPVREVLDFSDEGESIFGRKKPLVFRKDFSAQVLKANMKVVGNCEYGLILYRDRLPKFNNDGRMIFNCFDWVRDTDTPKIHPTQKPVPLLERLIEIFTDKGDVVIDPCAGSGTTLLAAANMGRKAYGFEIKKDFCAEARVKVLPRISKSLFV